MQAAPEAAASCGWLKVCVSCDRFSPAPDQMTSHGERLASALEAAFRRRPFVGQPALRRVHCLSGCRSPGNIEFGAARKWKLRFHAIGAADVEAVVAVAKAYLESGHGEPVTDRRLEPLKDRLAAAIGPQPPSPEHQVDPDRRPPDRRE